jgi:hypothetical protein
MIGRCESEFHQFKDRLEESWGLPSSQALDGLDCGHSLNRQVGISWRSAGLSGQFIGRPIDGRFGTDPDGASSPLFERGVILAPVADAVSGFLFKGYHITSSATLHSDSCNKAHFQHKKIDPCHNILCGQSPIPSKSLR